MTEAGSFSVELNAASYQDVTINYMTSGTATSGADYTALSNSITIPAGDTKATLTVTPIDDTIIEVTETVTVELQSANIHPRIG